MKNIKNFLCAGLFLLLFSGCQNIFTFTKSPSAPKKLSVKNITSESAVVTWQAAKNAGSYEVVWLKKGRDSGPGITVYKTRVELTELEYDEEYTVLVRAMPDSYSDKVNPSHYVKINFKTKDDIAPEGGFIRPRNVKIQLDDSNKIKLSWDPVENAVYYDIELEYQTSKQENIPIKYTVSAVSTEFIVENLKYGNAVVCKIAARNSDLTDSCRWSKPVSLEIGQVY